MYKWGITGMSITWRCCCCWRNARYSLTILRRSHGFVGAIHSTGGNVRTQRYYYGNDVALHEYSMLWHNENEFYVVILFMELQWLFSNAIDFIRVKINLNCTRFTWKQKSLTHNFALNSACWSKNYIFFSFSIHLYFIFFSRFSIRNTYFWILRQNRIVHLIECMNH